MDMCAVCWLEDNGMARDVCYRRHIGYGQYPEGCFVCGRLRSREEPIVAAEKQTAALSLFPTFSPQQRSQPSGMSNGARQATEDDDKEEPVPHLIDRPSGHEKGRPFMIRHFVSVRAGRGDQTFGDGG